MNLDYQRLCIEANDINEGIKKLRAELQKLNPEGNDFKLSELMKRSLAFFYSKDQTGQRFNQVSEYIKASLEQDRQGNIHELHASLVTREMNSSNEQHSIEAEIDGVKQELEEIKLDQSVKELELQFDEKK